MSNEEHPDPRYEGWEPTPQSGEYDADATAFVQLPPEDLAAIPLAAPGHGYVPPMIVPLTPAAGLDPAATGSWVVRTQSQQQADADRRAQEQPPGAVHWPDPNDQGGGYAQQPYQDTSHSTAQWNFTEAIGEQAGQPGGVGAGAEEHADHASHDGHGDHSGQGGHAGHSDHTGHFDTSAHTDHNATPGHNAPSGHTGQWTIPVADGDLPDESGEFLASAAASQQWYADDTRPATLPGGAPAPWATQPQPEEPPAADPAADGHPLPGNEPEAEAPPTEPHATADHARADTAPDTAPEPEPLADPAPEPPTDPDAATTPRADAEQPTEAEPEPDPSHDTAHDPVSDPSHDPVAAPLDVPSEHPAASYVLHVNGVDRPVSEAWIGESLLYVLRERLGLAGAKDGCSQGECGACNVQVDGRLVASCLVPAATAAGSEVRTVEGLAVDGEPSDVQRALSACGAVQCGFCIPGMAMTVHDLLEGNHAPSELETRRALCGNLCRCSGYRGVLDAVADVVASREASSETAAAAQDEPRIPHQAEPGAGGVHQHHSHEGGAQ
ncbi:2Fe-2S iron-sulfur cluster-binding protein [Streptomyces sp. NPDC101178]|uniref:2Fe-2S iron-sulfur cluster-binding protein n=1 Tax=Streptomyces sp. NPDC101178 TaxID=3366124 RepID=UPI0038106E76